MYKYLLMLFLLLIIFFNSYIKTIQTIDKKDK